MDNFEIALDNCVFIQYHECWQAGQGGYDDFQRGGVPWLLSP